MNNEPCQPCEEHAKLHSAGFGLLVSGEPCKQCEEHAVKHKNEKKVTWW